MKNFLLALTLFLFVFIPAVKADEGMWLLLHVDRLNQTELQKMGLQLTPEEIYSINNSSLKDAIAIFGRGCTAEVISDQGLLLTNHHCGYGQIQEHSSVEHDYLSNGFWAQNFEEELPNPGLTATFLIRVEDVTEAILGELKDEMTEQERSKAIRNKSQELQNAATEESHYTASVRSFFEGNEFYLFVYETFRDVRLVGAPPSSIGKFGADTDNWMWPRHTGDFALFRVYTDKEGKPADYSTDNIPMKPRHHLPVSLEGYQKGDFSMILGYPGGTQRYMTSHGVKMALDISNQTVVDIRDIKLKIMMEQMQADPAVRIQYATKYARISNYWKYFIGQNKGLKRLRVYDKKVELEDEFTQWVNQTADLKEKYGEALPMIAKAYNTISEYELIRIYQNEAIVRGSEILGFAGRFSNLKKELEEKNPDQAKVNQEVERLRGSSADYFKDYNASIDKKLLAAMFQMYDKNVPLSQQPRYMIDLSKKYKGNFEKFADMVFATSIFTTSEKVEAFLSKPSAKALDKDIAYQTIRAFNNFFTEEISPKTVEAREMLNKGNRLFVAGLREMNADREFYPDANFTMRMTYGQVLDYYPADAVHYNYFTTMTGIMEKEDPANWEFVVPEKLKALYEAKDFGRYGTGDVMNVCFLTNHDITGGNSGSPVLNGKGELIGLAFDGNWEAMSGDIAFEPDLQRTINVDIRYVLFIIDKYAGAKHLIDEMTIVQKRPKLQHELMEKAEAKAGSIEK
jgi:hypothetical protein